MKHMMMSSAALILFLSALHFLPTATASCANASAIFAFGDGYLDSGNNNQLITVCRLDHAPYGINLPGNMASGRPSNGELATDILVSALGIKKLLPPYLDPGLTAQDLLTGVSFASACSGLDEYSAVLAKVLSIPRQFALFEEAVERMKLKVGEKAATQAVQNAVFIISGGTHDMLNNFYLQPSRAFLPVAEYFELLLGNIQFLINSVHSMGAMKIAVMGMPPLGCIPIDVTANSIAAPRECVEKHNADAQDYNNQLLTLTRAMQFTLPGTKIVYVDIYSPMMDMIKKSDKKCGLESCCGTGAVEMGILCNDASAVCDDPSKYVFWDSFHPSKATYTVIAKKLQQTVVSTLLA